MIKSATTDAPATPKQRAFIARLDAERDHAVDVPAGPLTTQQAGVLIERLLAAPRRPQTDGPEGWYLHEGEVYAVRLNEAGTGVYAVRLEVTGTGYRTARWKYAPGMVPVLAGTPRLQLMDAAELSRQYGVCVVCARRLVQGATGHAGCSARLQEGSS